MTVDFNQRTVQFALMVLCFFGSMGTAGAQDDADVDKREKAQEYFDRGEVLAENGEYTKAAAAFLLAYETLPHPSSLYNVALCNDKAGKIPEAVEYYRRFLEVGMGSADAKQVLERLVELDTLVGQIHVTCSTPGCTIEINGVNRGEAPVWAVVEPGTHSIIASAEDATFEKKDVLVSRSKTSKVAMEPIAQNKPPAHVQRIEAPLPEPRPAPSFQVVSTQPPRLGVPFWMATGLTVAAGGMIAVFGALAQKHHDDFVASSNTDTELKEKGENAVTATNVMIAVTSVAGAAAIGLGIHDLWFSEPDAPDTQIAIVPGPSLGLGVTRRF